MMNERGKELIENFRWESRLPSNERRITYSMTPEELEKFAELIIKECAEVAADRDALNIYEEIRDHFGVES